MFYVAQALLLGKDLASSRHSAVIAAFGRHLAKPGHVPRELHKHLIEAMELRQAGDYGSDMAVTRGQADHQIARARSFLDLCGRMMEENTPG